MNYIPKVNDYVKWTNPLGQVTEGWVYFACDLSISIEVGVKDKPKCMYTKEEKHKKIHILVVCPNFLWHELEYIKCRKSHYDDEPADTYKSQPYRNSDP